MALDSPFRSQLIRAIALRISLILILSLNSGIPRNSSSLFAFSFDLPSDLFSYHACSIRSPTEKPLVQKKMKRQVIEISRAIFSSQINSNCKF